MNFSTLVLRNVFRRRMRSVLTMFAVSIAVAAVVALVGVSKGFQDSFTRFYRAQNIDLIITAQGQRKMSAGIPDSLTERIAKLPGVVEVIPGLVDITSFEGMPIVPISGLTPSTPAFDRLNVVDGETITRSDTNEVLLGAGLAETLGKEAEDTLNVVEDTPFVIKGVYESKYQYENNMIVMSIEQLQKLMGRDGTLTGISVVFGDDVTDAQRKEVAAKIQSMEKGLAVKSTEEHIESIGEIQMAVNMAWLTSAIAIVVGALGTLNTMLMSIQERTSEIGLLKAIGWDRKMILGLIMGESVALSVLGGLMGVIGGVVLVKALTQLRMASGIIEGVVSPEVLLQAFLMAIIVGFIGGLVPAILASRLAPTVALRQ